MAAKGEQQFEKSNKPSLSSLASTLRSFVAHILKNAAEELRGDTVQYARHNI